MKTYQLAGAREMRGQIGNLRKSETRPKKIRYKMVYPVELSPTEIEKRLKNLLVRVK